ncbi:MAG: DNA primase [Tissierellia bacterium]|nr:DNA primase [Tissierellia bacterium]
MINIENYKNIPSELKEYNQWVWFKIYKEVDKNGVIKSKKVPVSPVTHRSSEWNKKENWTSFEKALCGLKSSNCDGLSFVLTKYDQFVCIDLDDIKNHRHKYILNDLKETYQEASYSNNGVHIFAKGTITKNINNQIEKVEIYGENKAIAMTGNVDILGHEVTEIIEFQEQIDKLFLKFAPNDSTQELKEKYKNFNDDVPDIHTIVKTIYMKHPRARDLLTAKVSSGDASKDDFELLLYLNTFTHGNSDLMKEIFLRSPLSRLGDRSKRRTEQGYLKYLDRTIDKVLFVGSTDYWNYHLDEVAERRQYFEMLQHQY